MTNLPGYGVGYSTIAKYLLPYFENIVGKGNLALTTNYGFQGEQIHFLKEFPDMPIYGHGRTGMNEESMVYYYQHFNADVFMPIFDIWALNHLPAAGEKGQICFVPWVPVDTDEASKDMIRACRGAFRLIPMSQHTEKALKKHFPDKVYPAILPGVDTKIYRPLWASRAEKGALKKKLGFLEDAFIIGMLGDGRGDRKAWAETIEGISIFIKKNSEKKIRVYLHTSINRQSGGDYDMAELLEYFGIVDYCRTVDQIPYRIGTPDEIVVETYNAFDVFIQTSAGEGAGMSFIEAQACGTPCIGTDFTSMPEVIDPKTGLLVKPLMNRLGIATVRRAIPDPENIANKLVSIYLSLTDEKDQLFIRDACRQFAMKFDWEQSIVPQWQQAFARLEYDIKKACLKPGEPSALLKEWAKDIKVVEGK